MSDDLYILAATAVKRYGPPQDRRVVIEYALAPSREEAFKKARKLIFERHFSPLAWRDPLLRVENIPAQRIQWYRKALVGGDNSLIRLTFLWGYAVFYHESSSFRCGTIISQTKQIAEESVTFGPARHVRGRKDFFLSKIPLGFIFPWSPRHGNPEKILRIFPDILKK